MSRAYTAEEIRNKFLGYIRHLVWYWDTHADDRNTRGKLSGLAFSILAMLDGCAIDIPAFLIVPSPHPEDKQ